MKRRMRSFIALSANGKIICVTKYLQNEKNEYLFVYYNPGRKIH